VSNRGYREEVFNVLLALLLHERGVRAFCLKRNNERVFRVDRILEIKEV
jgi:predicted DNA-binding transcriptional regulator YafY